jgi:hypothetical protein
MSLGTQCSAGLVGRQSQLSNLRGENVTFSTSNTGAAVLVDNKANIVQSDIMQEDGVVNIIDAALIPGQVVSPPTPTGAATTGVTAAATTGKSSGVRLASGIFTVIFGLICIALF